MERPRLFVVPWLTVVMVGVLVVCAGSARAASGATVWVNRYNGPGNGADSARATAVSPDGSLVFVTGASAGRRSTDFATEAIAASTGATVWTARYDGSGHADDQACCIAVSPDGSTVFVTGRSESVSAGYDYVTIAYATGTGAVRWVSRYSGPGHGDDLPAGLAVSPSGTTVFVTGSSDGGTATGVDYATVALNAASGARRWVARYNGLAGGNDTASGLAVSPDGSQVIVTGASAVPGHGLDWATISYDPASGARQWVVHYNNGRVNGDDSPRAIAISPDSSRVFITGSATVAAGEEAIVTRAYTTSKGVALWGDMRDGTPHNSGSAIGVSPSGTEVFVCSSAGNVVVYSAATGGPPLSNTGFFDTAAGLAVSPNGSTFYVTGTFLDNYWTVGLAQDPVDPLWQNKYNGPGNGTDNASAIAVSPDTSTVYVTGQSTGAGTGTDYATEAIAG